MRSRIIPIIEIILLALLTIPKYLNVEVVEYLDKHPEVRSLVSFILFVLFIDLFRRLLNFTYARRKNLTDGEKGNFQYGINNITRLLVGLGFIVSLFGFFGIDIMSLMTSLSIVAAAIAIITREYLNDFITGIYFSFSKDFEINDYVQIGTNKGKIVELQMLKIKILNDDDVVVIIPNGKVYNTEIINYTKRDIRSMSIDFQIDIRAIQNLELLEEELIKSLEDFDEFIEDDSFNMKIVDMKKDYIDLKFQYTLKVMDRELQRQIRRNTVREVFNFISEKKTPGPTLTSGHV